MPSVMTFERQKMSVEMWEKLKTHIMRQREKRKQEQEQDAEQERHRREQELKRKRDATTLEDIKDQLSKLESRLKELKEEKHELFLQLKKVLNEDEVRKRQKESEIMAAHQALQAQQQINLQNAINFYSNSNLYSKQSPMPLIPTSQALSIPSTASQPTSIPSSVVTSQQQHMYAKLSPMPVSLASTMNNSVITQSVSMSGQSSQINASKRPSNKRLHERSPSPQPAIPYTGILPIYKTTLAYTPNLNRNPPVSQPLYYQPPTSQIVSNQANAGAALSFDGKSNPFQFLSSGLPPGTSVEAFQEQSNQLAAVNSAALSQQQLNQLQQELYHQQLRGMAAGLHPNQSMLPMQSTPKQGSISGGFPIQRQNVNVSQASVGSVVNTPATQARNFQQRFLF